MRTWFKSWGAPIAGLVAVVTVLQAGDPGGAGAATTAQPALGLYRKDNDPAEVRRYESWLGGHSVTYAHVLGGKSSWREVESPKVEGWRAAGKTVMLSFTVMPGPADRSGVGEGKVSLDACGDGRYDQHFAALGRHLVANGQAGAVLRPMREFNGDWYAWGIHAQDDPRQYERDFVRCWRRVVDRLRATSGERFEFTWNVLLGPRRADTDGEPWAPAGAWPGDGYVDYVGLDVYDGGYPAYASESELQALRPAHWRSKLEGPQGLKEWAGFAVNHNKALSVPEWGLLLWKYDGAYRGGGDNAVFVRGMAQFINDPGNRVHDHAFWEATGKGVFDPDSRALRQPYIPVPRARAAFRDAFPP